MPPTVQQDVVPVGDLICASGLGNLGTDPPPDAVEAALRQLATLLAEADPLRAATVRAEAKRVLKNAKVIGASALVDAAFGAGRDAPPSDSESGRRTLADVDPWPEPVNGEALLDELAQTYARFIALPPHAAVALALWTVLAHAHDAFTISPILALVSPVPACGKTTALSVLSALVPRTLFASNLRSATLFRTIDAWHPTLLIDEADTFLDGDEEMRGVLDSGHNRVGAFVMRLVGDDHRPEPFTTWCPKVIAKIGTLHPTLRSRSVVVPLRRRRRNDRVERIRMDRLPAELETLRRKCARWAQDHLENLRAADPVLPGSLADRSADNWRPLIAIAEAAGGDWPLKARHAALALSGRNEEDDTIGVHLLADLRDLWAARSGDKFFSGEIVTALNHLVDRPWSEGDRGKPLTESGLAKLLKPFGITSRKIRIGDDSRWGYRRSDFNDAFERYLPEDGARPEQAEHPSNAADSLLLQSRNEIKHVPEQVLGVPGADRPGNRALALGVPAVPARTPLGSASTNTDGDLLGDGGGVWE